MKAGPKAAANLSPLPLSRLPKQGGSRVIGFLRRYIVVPKGTGALHPVRVRHWQRDLINKVFDEPRPRLALWSMPRGNGKSTLAAMLGLYGLHGDCEEGASVVVVASDERQAGIVWRAALRMTELSKPLLDRTQLYQDRLYVPRTGSEFRVLPAEAHRLEGLDPSLAIVDEIGVVPRETYEAMASASGKRARSLILCIGTPSPGRDESVMWDLRQHGLSNGHDPSFVFAEYAARDLSHPVDCRHCWAEANPGLGDLIHVDAMAALLPPKLREPAFRRYRLGQWLEVLADQWMSPEIWKACRMADAVSGYPDAGSHHSDRLTHHGDQGAEEGGDPIDAAPRRFADGVSQLPVSHVVRNLEVVLALTGSPTGDCTALVSATVEDVPHIVVEAYWEPQEGAVDVVDVEEAIRETVRIRTVVSIVADPFRWSRTLQILAAENLPVIEYPQAPARMIPATTRFYEAAVNRTLTHDGNDQLAKHVLNAVVKTDSRGSRITKEHRYSNRRIDLAVAAVMAHDRAADLKGKTFRVW